MTYTWDNNGNLLSDGANTYTYDHANRLKSVVGSSTTSSFGYRCNGLSSDPWGIIGCQSDRVSQTVDGVTTNYTLDQAAGLPHVLSDGTNSYLYGNGRIAQYGDTGPEYFLTDGLGSVRQLVDNSGAVILTKNYQPFGEGLNHVGNEYSSYGFTGEMTDLTGLIYLRARYYAPQSGRFLTKDVWPGEYTKPLSLNGWNYVAANPINRVDPTGLFPNNCDTLYSDKCDPTIESSTKWLLETMRTNAISKEAKIILFLNKWAYTNFSPPIPIILPPFLGLPPLSGPCSPAAGSAKALAYIIWIKMVKTDAPWDYKLKIYRKESGFEWGGEHYQMCCSQYSYENPSNIHYGYVGKAAGFGDLELKAGAGVAQYWQHRLSPEYQKLIEAGKVGLHTYFDEPEDQAGIEIGLSLFRSPDALTPNKFCKIFNRYAHRLKK